MVDGGLGPEASADRGSDDAQLVRREVQHLAERALEPVRDLGRGPDREPAAERGRLGQDPPRLDRHPGVSRHADAGAHAQRRVRKGTLGVADPDLEGDADVVAPLLVEDRGARPPPRPPRRQSPGAARSRPRRARARPPRRMDRRRGPRPPARRRSGPGRGPAGAGRRSSGGTPRGPGAAGAARRRAGAAGAASRGRRTRSSRPRRGGRARDPAGSRGSARGRAGSGGSPRGDSRSAGGRRRSALAPSGGGGPRGA